MAQLGTNTRLGYSTNITAPTWSVLPEMIEVTAPTVEVEDVQNTVYGVTRRVFKPGLQKLGDMSVTVFYDPADTVLQNLIASAGNVVLFCLAIKEPDNKYTSFKWTGFITKYDIKTPMDGNMEITFDIKPDGETWTITNSGSTDPLA